MSILRTILLFSLFSMIFPSQAQTIHWRNYVDKTFVFEINAQEAEKILRSQPKDSLMLKIAHNRSPLTSFSKEWKNQPEKGHFILADIVENRVAYRYINIIPFQVFLFKEYDALTLQVIDENGEIRKDAKIKIKKSEKLFKRLINFDEKTQTYTINETFDREKSGNENHILSVKLDGFEVFFDLAKYYPYKNYWNDNRYNESPQFYSYLITDKNKYKPGETVRFKSYVLSGNRSPLKKELEVLVDSRKITTLTPYNPGGYAGEFQLHDSLKLRLDRSYYLQLRDDKGKIVSSTYFRYEDYELNNEAGLHVKLQKDTHYFPDTNRIEIRVTDVNGLLLQDLKADVLIKRRNVQKSYTDLLVLPDTLMYKRIDLDNSSSTWVDIPAALFGESDCSYDIQVQVVNFDNRVLNYYRTVNYYRSNYNLVYKTAHDTLCFDFYELGKKKDVMAIIRYDNSKEKKKIKLPYRELFNPKIQEYDIYIPEADFQKKIRVSELYSNLELTGGIVADSLNIQLVNPLKLEVSWYFYKGEYLLEKGFGKEIDIKYQGVVPDYTYYVDLFYTFGNRENSFRRTFSVKETYLSVDVNLPDRIYPGQQVDVTVKVEDSNKNPVRGVDLTAFSVNSLLGHWVPDLPYYGKRVPYRERRPDYSLAKNAYTLQAPLDYEFWNQWARLDAMNYYRFTYPYNKLFRYEIDTPDSTTQFAPYVMKDGKAVVIHVIEHNRTPVYFSWTEQPKFYSFIASDSIANRITLRLHDRIILLDSMKFEKDKKTIFSLDLDHLPENARVIMVGSALTSNEKSVYGNLISRIEVKNRKFTYLKQEDVIYPVYLAQFPTKAYNNSLAGPIPNGKTDYNGEIVYNHKNGYSYEYEGNVVYKSPYAVCPDYFHFSSNNNFNQLEQFYLSQARLKKLSEKPKEEEYKSVENRWHPSHINILLLRGINLNFQFPEEKDSSGVDNLMFRNRATKELIFADIYAKGRLSYPQIPPADYDVILLYNNGKYLIYENIPVKTNSYLALDMSESDLHKEDSISNKWQELSAARIRYIPNQSYNGSSVTKTLTYQRPTMSGRKVTGVVSDVEGPIPMASVVIKGTNLGVATDLDGCFELALPEGRTHELVISSAGSVSQTIKVSSGSHISVILKEDVRELDEFVVVGYGRMKKSDLTGAVGSVGSMSEDRIRNSVAEEDPEETTAKTETEKAEEALYNELMQLNGLRKNFSDVGFWEPRLYTDKKGMAEFKVTFPDNITQWDAIIYAMNRKLQTGTFRKSLKSYKPLMAELKTPSFLVAGDSTYLAANIRNYLNDKDIKGSVLFLQNQDTLMNKKVNFSSSHRDNPLMVAADTDSITGTYLFTRNDGYMDGEERTIPIVPQGTEIAKGSLSLLRNGDKLDIVADKGENIHIEITAKQLDIYMDATRYLTGYQHACNEQLASKLTGLLLHKKIQQYLGEKFENDKNVNEIIQRLLTNRNSKQMWSWWGTSDNTSLWISAHVMDALLMAKEAGYEVKLELKSVKRDYTDMEVESLRPASISDVGILYSLFKGDAAENYTVAIDRFEREIHKQEAWSDSFAPQHKTKRYSSYLKEKLQLWEMRQKQNYGYVSDSIRKYLKEDILGAVYCSDGIDNYWYSDDLATTLIAYRIIRNDSALQHFKEPVQLHILGTKQKYYGWNTYQAANIISTILPDLLNESGNKKITATVSLSGKENKTLTEFPYKTVLSAGERLQIEKKDGIPVIY